jgi:hypothetical protein
MYHLTDWLLYWQASEEAEAGRAVVVDKDAKPQGNNTTRPNTSPTAPSTSFKALEVDNVTKSESDTPSTITPISTPIDLDDEPTAKKPFAYYPHLIFLGLLLQLLFFYFQFDNFRRNGLPGFVARWPVIYAVTAPANTGIYMVGVVRLAPAKWPRLRTWRFVELGESCVWGGWVVWSVGVWLIVRGW